MEDQKEKGSSPLNLTICMLSMKLPPHALTQNQDLFSGPHVLNQLLAASENKHSGWFHFRIHGPSTPKMVLSFTMILRSAT